MSKGNSNHFSATKGQMASVNFYVGPGGKTLLAEHRHWLGVNRRESMLKKAKDIRLKNLVSSLYRQNSIIGDGSSASALKFEKRTGLGLGKNGNTHNEKSIEFFEKDRPYS